MDIWCDSTHHGVAVDGRRCRRKGGHEHDGLAGGLQLAILHRARQQVARGDECIVVIRLIAPYLEAALYSLERRLGAGCKALHTTAAAWWRHS